jgi:hypothetical protein
MAEPPSYDEVIRQSEAPAHLADDGEVVDGMPLLFRDGALEMEHTMPVRCTVQPNSTRVAASGMWHSADTNRVACTVSVCQLSARHSSAL